MVPSADADLLDWLQLIARQFLDAVPPSIRARMIHFDHVRLDRILISADNEEFATHPYSSELAFALELIHSFEVRERMFEDGLFSRIFTRAAEEETLRNGGFNSEIVCYFISRYFVAYYDMVRYRTRDSQKRMLTLRIPSRLLDDLDDQVSKQGRKRTDFVVGAIRHALQRPQGPEGMSTRMNQERFGARTRPTVLRNTYR